MNGLFCSVGNALDLTLENKKKRSNPLGVSLIPEDCCFKGTI